MLADERPPGGESLEPIARDVDGRGSPVEDQLGQAAPDGGCGLEAGPREPAGEVEAIRPGPPEDPMLVWRDPILAAVARAERAVGHPRHARTDPADHLLDEIGARPRQRPVGRTAD